MRDVGVFDREFPGQEQLGVALPRGEVRRVKAVAVARDDGVGLAGVEHHHRAPAQGDALAGGREVQVQALVFAEEQVAESRRTVLPAVVVVTRAPAGHQRDVAAVQQVGQALRMCPVGYGLHVVPVVGPAGACAGQRQGLHIAELQAQAGDLSFAVCR